MPRRGHSCCLRLELNQLWTNTQIHISTVVWLEQGIRAKSMGSSLHENNYQPLHSSLHGPSSSVQGGKGYIYLHCVNSTLRFCEKTHVMRTCNLEDFRFEGCSCCQRVRRLHHPETQSAQEFGRMLQHAARGFAKPSSKFPSISPSIQPHRASPDPLYTTFQKSSEPAVPQVVQLDMVTLQRAGVS